MADKLKKETLVELQKVLKEEHELEFELKTLKSILFSAYSVFVLNDEELNDVDAIISEIDFDYFDLMYKNK
jgi:hypothetical protein